MIHRFKLLLCDIFGHKPKSYPYPMFYTHRCGRCERMLYIDAREKN